MDILLKVMRRHQSRDHSTRITWFPVGGRLVHYLFPTIIASGVLLLRYFDVNAQY